MMDTCESFEIAIEEQRLGTLSADATRALDEHLVTCTSCQKFAAFVRDSEAKMMTADAKMDEADWAVVKKQLRRAPERVRSHWFLTVTIVSAMAPLVVLSLGTQTRALAGIGIVTFVPLAIFFFALRYVVFDRRMSRDMQRAGKTNTEFFGQFRKLLTQQKRWLWVGIVGAPFYAMQEIGIGITLDVLSKDQNALRDQLSLACRSLLLVVAFAISIWLYRNPLKRVRETLAQL